MPSTIGHALAGATVAWSAQAVGARYGVGHGARHGVGDRVGHWWLTAACVAIAMAPDADLAVGVHRTFTHSFTMTAIVAAIAAMIAERAKLPVALIATTCAAAHASHLFLDWLAVDNYPPYGMQLFWPFSDHWYISDLNWFLGTRRQQFLSATAIKINARAVGRELLILGPIAYTAWLVRVKALTRFAPEMAGGHHPPQ